MRSSAAYEVMPEAEASEVWSWLEWKFGIPVAAMARYRLWRRPGAPSIWLAARSAEPPEGFDPEGIGLMLTRHPPPRGFPTTAFAQRFGHLATRRVVDVDEPLALALLRGDALVAAPDAPSGVVFIRGPLAILGRGWVREGKLTLDFPASRRIRIEAPPDP